MRRVLQPARVEGEGSILLVEIPGEQQLVELGIRAEGDLIHLTIEYGESPLEALVDGLAQLFERVGVLDRPRERFRELKTAVFDRLGEVDLVELGDDLELLGGGRGEVGSFRDLPVPERLEIKAEKPAGQA